LKVAQCPTPPICLLFASWGRVTIEGFIELAGSRIEEENQRLRITAKVA
jgi:hypothetical protein